MGSLSLFIVLLCCLLTLALGGGSGEGPFLSDTTSVCNLSPIVSAFDILQRLCRIVESSAEDTQKRELLLLELLKNDGGHPHILTDLGLVLARAGQRDASLRYASYAIESGVPESCKWLITGERLRVFIIDAGDDTCGTAESLVLEGDYNGAVRKWEQHLDPRLRSLCPSVYFCVG